MWIAKDFSGKLLLFENFPIRHEEGDVKEWVDISNRNIDGPIGCMGVLPECIYPELKWEDEPIELDFTIHDKTLITKELLEVVFNYLDTTHYKNEFDYGYWKSDAEGYWYIEINNRNKSFGGDVRTDVRYLTDLKYIFRLCGITDMEGFDHYFNNRLSDDERIAYARSYLKCIKDCGVARKGTACKVGEIYHFEYVNDDDCFYRKLSDNKHHDEVILTDEELLHNFEIFRSF